ncbi:TlpA family protein disulfide reductase [Flavobacteriaceae bacterium XHP0103]|uniref:TlpA family protein disulfide reductase n=1 Tax=Marixanthotalea marina TaxID=2844359 RepID=UPI002989E4DE|nr:TlpA disulfide reductase family protein [Marixanthotalea marina]MBU3821163.1 TlpA family protein disulfide reductase [Marixanthotalea marina]
MKTSHILTTTLLIFFLVTGCQKQEQDKGTNIGELHISKTFPKPGDSLKLSFAPDKDVLENENEFESLFYALVDDQMYPEDIHFNKNTDSIWQAIIKIPDSAKALAFNFKTGETYLNNHNEGYVIPLYTKNETQLIGSQSSMGMYYYRYANAHNIKIDKKDILSLLKNDIETNPESKEKLDLTYLNLLNREDHVSGKLLINQEIDSLASKGDLTEKEYSKLTSLYSFLGEREKVDSIVNLAAEKFPNGNAAMNKFLNDFYEEKDLNKKITIFEEFSAKAKSKKDASLKDYMANVIANEYTKKKDYEGFFKYSNQISNKSNLASMYNNMAWNMALKDENLDFASEISKKSLDLVKKGEKSPYISKNQYEKSMESSYFMYADTYAFILSKQGKLDEAIEYQKPVAYSIKKGKGDKDGVIERYIEFMSKDKQFESIEKEASQFIKDGNGTQKTKEYLKTAYENNHESIEDFDDYLTGLEAEAEEMLIAELQKKIIDEEAPDFTLTNLNNEEVTLSSLKGKTVILDFWATWCGPCKQSFPGMQVAVNKYKDNPNVAFLFIDTWENGTTEENNKNVVKFIKDNKYSFNVLFDTKTSDEASSPYKVVEDYKVSGIPTKFIIGPDGRIKFKSVGFGGSVDGLVNELDHMIEFTQSVEPIKS